MVTALKIRKKNHQLLFILASLTNEKPIAKPAKHLAIVFQWHTHTHTHMHTQIWAKACHMTTFHSEFLPIWEIFYSGDRFLLILLSDIHPYSFFQPLWASLHSLCVFNHLPAFWCQRRSATNNIHALIHTYIIYLITCTEWVPGPFPFFCHQELLIFRQKNVINSMHGY